MTVKYYDKIFGVFGKPVRIDGVFPRMNRADSVILFPLVITGGLLYFYSCYILDSYIMDGFVPKLNVRL